MHVSWHYDQKEVDGVVADLTITSERLKLVDFTQPYVQSVLKMVVPLETVYHPILDLFSPILFGTLECNCHDVHSHHPFYIHRRVFQPG